MSDIVIVGGGPSLIKFDWQRLRGMRIIAVNRAYEVLPWAEIVYFADLRFWHWNKFRLIAHRGRKITTMPRVDDKDVEHWKITGYEGLDLEPKQIRQGNNSGYAAINIAVHMGAKRIFLFGFDMCHQDDRSHWHNGYPVISRERVFDKMLPHFHTLNPPLRELGVEVINACQTSKLECFRKCTIDEALSMIDQPERRTA